MRTPPAFNRLLALALAVSMSTACNCDEDAANTSDSSPAPRQSSARKQSADSYSAAYSKMGDEYCVDAPGASSKGSIGGVGESSAQAQSRLFDGAKSFGQVRAKSSTPVFAGGGGRKCFDGLTKTAYSSAGLGSGGGLKTSDVPLALAKSQLREKRALANVIPGGPVVMEAYERFQQEAYDKAYGVLDRLGWGAKKRKGEASPTTPVRMTVHHTEGNTPHGEQNTAQTARNIQHYHMVGRALEGKQAFQDIGYHFLIAGDGRVVQGRPSNMLGAHAHGANRGNLGIALMGNFMKKDPTPDQMESLKRLVAYLAVKYRVDPKKSGALEGHAHHTATSCPGSLLMNKLAALRIAASEEMLAMLKRSRLAAESVRLTGLFNSRSRSLA
ncbi:MAG: peptidoglycan recognition family protein [Elusimicrobiota bacterium]